MKKQRIRIKGADQEGVIEMKDGEKLRNGCSYKVKLIDPNGNISDDEKEYLGFQLNSLGQYIENEQPAR